MPIEHAPVCVGSIGVSGAPPQVSSSVMFQLSRHSPGSPSLTPYCIGPPACSLPRKGHLSHWPVRNYLFMANCAFLPWAVRPPLPRVSCEASALPI